MCGHDDNVGKQTIVGHSHGHGARFYTFEKHGIPELCKFARFPKLLNIVEKLQVVREMVRKHCIWSHALNVSLPSGLTAPRRCAPLLHATSVLFFYLLFEQS